jgi:glycosyltransferase involved in cell wall biosynthesis
MRILIVTQYFPPETGAPQARLYELAERLARKGHNVTVLTALPNYPAGRIFPGYRRRLRMAACQDGIRVIRTWIYPSKSVRTFPRLMSYLSFAVSSVVLGCWRLGAQDVVLCESPPLFLVPSGLLIARFTGARSVMNVSDIWPDILVRMGHARPGIALKLMGWLERFGYEHADVIAVTNPGAARQVNERFPRVRMTIISNGVDTKLFCPELRSKTVRERFGVGANDFLVCYCGLHGLAQGLEAVIGAADHLRGEPRIRFLLIGDGPTKEALVKMTRDKRLNNVQFHDPQPRREMPAILASSDVSLVPLATRLPGTMPSKFYEALASGTPPIVAKGCEAETLVLEFNAGRAFEPLDSRELADAVWALANDGSLLAEIRRNCLRLASRFDRDVIAERTEAVLQAVAENQELPEVRW